MNFKNLVPWRRGRREIPVRREDSNPIAALRRDIERVFDHFWSDFGVPLISDPFGSLMESPDPRLEVSETDEEIEISAELPGLTEDDIEVSITDDALRIEGEKKTEKEEKRKDYYIAERSYGSFQRVIPLPGGLALDKVKASFRNGVLTITLPKTEEARASVKRIPVTTS